MNDFEKKEEIFSKPVRAGKRTYFFDVKATKGNEYFITVTESKKKFNEDGTFFYEKHKIFLYKEDFEKFMDGLTETVQFIRQNQPAMTIEHTHDSNGGNERNSLNFEDLGNK